MSPKKQPRRVALYVRLSISTDASVSIDRQVEAAQQYADQRGWTIVGTFVDDGVSASKNRPEDRDGWRALMAHPEPWDAVIVWKLDRLVRRITWFWETYQWLEDQGRSLVSVMDNLDMTTPMGRIIAGIIAGFAEMESEATSARVADARRYLLANGRVGGGKAPYGYRNVPNPEGPGFVLAQDPAQIEHVRGMVERTRAGRTIYSTVQWLNDSGAPTPTGLGAWIYSTVERILRNPVLAGMVAYNPGNASKERGSEVVRGTDGLPVVYPDLAVLSVREWRAMVVALDTPRDGRSTPKALRAKTSGMLSGLVVCAEHDGEPVRMWRGTIQGRQGYKCPSCYMSLSNFEHVVEAEFLRQKGEHVRWTTAEEVTDGGEALVAEIDVRTKELRDRQDTTEDDAEYDRLEAEVQALRARRREARTMPSVVHTVAEPASFFADDWTAASTDEEKRDVLGDALERIWVRRARPGRRTDAQLLARLTFDWRMPGQVGPLDGE